MTSVIQHSPDSYFLSTYKGDGSLLQYFLCHTLLSKDDISKLNQFSRIIILDSTFMNKHKTHRTSCLENASQAIINNVVFQVTWNRSDHKLLLTWVSRIGFRVPCLKSVSGGESSFSHFT